MTWEVINLDAGFVCTIFMVKEIEILNVHFPHFLFSAIVLFYLEYLNMSFSFEMKMTGTRLVLADKTKSQGVFSM